MHVDIVFMHVHLYYMYTCIYMHISWKLSIPASLGSLQRLFPCGLSWLCRLQLDGRN